MKHADVPYFTLFFSFLSITSVYSLGIWEADVAKHPEVLEGSPAISLFLLVQFMCLPYVYVTNAIL